MNRYLFNIGIIEVILAVVSFATGSGHQNADDKEAPPKVAKAGATDDSKPHILEAVDLAPGKSITPQDQVSFDWNSSTCTGTTSNNSPQAHRATVGTSSRRSGTHRKSSRSVGGRTQTVESPVRELAEPA